jgi:hypothetical protein
VRSWICKIWNLTLPSNICVFVESVVVFRAPRIRSRIFFFREMNVMSWTSVSVLDTISTETIIHITRMKYDWIRMNNN